MPLINSVVGARPASAGVSVQIEASMGQEDVYRDDADGNRVDNALTGRVLVSLPEPRPVKVVYWVDGTLDSAGNGATETPFQSGSSVYEFFFDLQALGALYAFEVRDDQDQLVATRGYFTTGSAIALADPSVTATPGSAPVNFALLPLAASLPQGDSSLEPQPAPQASSAYAPQTETYAPAPLQGGRATADTTTDVVVQ